MSLPSNLAVIGDGADNKRLPEEEQAILDLIKARTGDALAFVGWGDAVWEDLPRG